MPREQTPDEVYGAIDSWLRAADDQQERTHHGAHPFDAEERKERDWHGLETAAREFAASYGPAAMVRCISEALR